MVNRIVIAWATVSISAPRALVAKKCRPALSCRMAFANVLNCRNSNLSLCQRSRRNKFMRNFLCFALVILAGCASPPIYHKPPSSLSREERRKIFDEYSSSYGLWHGFRVDGILSTPPESYLIEHGDADSASLARKSRAYSLLGLGVGLAGVTWAYVRIENSNAGKVDATYWITVLGGLMVQDVITYFSRGHYLAQASESYNNYLMKDLDLPASQSK